MVGINELPDISSHVLYASPITKSFVNARFPGINCESLEIGYPTSLEVNEMELSVTCLPSGHCPGSVMFLFETKDEKRILYTGDFRITKKDMHKIIELNKQSLDTLYVDSTFFKTDYTHFPSQSQSIKKIIELIKDFIKKDTSNKVLFKFPARIGYEYLIIQLYKHFNMKIHVKEEIYCDFYRAVSSLGKITSASNFASSQIHVISDLTNLELYKKYKTILIKPTAMVWRNWHPGQDLHIKENSNTFRICYSNHSSFHEIKDLIMLTKPKKIELNVLPTNEKERHGFLENVRKIQAIYNKCTRNEEKAVKCIKTFPPKFKRLHSMTDTDSLEFSGLNNDCLKTVDSAILLPRKKRKIKL
jgi:DNA cross-link repair 1C protein